MADRITDAHLQRLCKNINKALGVPDMPYLQDEDGNAVYKDGCPIANAGNVHVAGAYGGTRLEQMSEGGGARNLADMPLGTKKACWHIGHAYLAGIMAAP